MRQRSILWFSLSETTSIEIQANLLKPEINQHQLSFKQNSFEGPVDWAFVGKISGSRGVALSLGAIRAFVGSDLGFRGEEFGLSRGSILSWGAIRAFVGSDSGFRGKEFGLSFGFSWGRIRAFGVSQGGIQNFVGMDCEKSNVTSAAKPA